MFPAALRAVRIETFPQGYVPLFGGFFRYSPNQQYTAVEIAKQYIFRF
jgi:hypothetical protein